MQPEHKEKCQLRSSAFIMKYVRLSFCLNFYD